MGITAKDLHIDTHLTQIAINYRPMGMIADQIAPIVRVAKQSNRYPIWSRGDALRVPKDKRSPGVEANKIVRNVSSDTYFADNYALKTGLTIEDIENADEVFRSQLAEGNTQFLVSQLMLAYEKRVASLVTSTSNVGSSSTVTSAWTEHANGNSNPLGDCWTALYNIEDATSIKANSAVWGNKAWREFRQHADVIDILYGNAAAPPGSTRYASQEQARAIFDLDRFLVGGVYENTDEEGQSDNTPTLSSMWDDEALFYFAPLAPSLNDPSFLYSFRWNRPGLANMTVERHPFDSKTKSQEIEVGYYQDEKIVTSDLGFLLNAVNSAQ